MLPLGVVQGYRVDVERASVASAKEVVVSLVRGVQGECATVCFHGAVVGQRHTDKALATLYGGNGQIGTDVRGTR